MISDANKITVSTEQDISYNVTKVLCYDETKDIAILQTEKPISADKLTLGNSESVLKGEKVTAIGSPLGLKNSISTGILSGRRYDATWDINSLQFTASISSGSSGGALFNEKSKVIGITFASYDNGQNLNLAVPIEYVTELYKKKSTPLSINEYLSITNPGIILYNESIKITYDELISNPNFYKNKLVSFKAYVLERSKIDIKTNSKWTRKFGFNTLMYIGPSKEGFGIEPHLVVLYNFKDIPIIICNAGPDDKQPENRKGVVKFVNSSQLASVGDYIEVCGYFYCNEPDGTINKTIAHLKLQYYKIISK